MKVTLYFLNILVHLHNHNEKTGKKLKSKLFLLIIKKLIFKIVFISIV